MIRLDRLARFLVSPLVSRPEPKVNWRRDRHGSLLIEIYDPVTQSCHSFKSEQEALIWLDRRYYTDLQKF